MVSSVIMDMDCMEISHMKKDWYEKGLDKVNIHLYVRGVEEHEIIFEENQVIVKFSTKHISFLKNHVKGRDKTAFSYIIKTRGEIDNSACYFKVKPPFIELILKKKIPEKWGSLERFDINKLLSTKETKTTKKVLNKSQLLGGKSTPVGKKNLNEGKQEGGVKVDNQQPESSHSTGDKKNIKKTLPSSSHAESLLGLTGLENYANNCYMNVVIQILANIHETRDFFNNDHFLKEINSNNPLGSGGKVAKAFADVAKALWSIRKNAFKPSGLKSIMGKRCSLFLGWQQHDAQEFFASLLDNLHEDLNQFSGEKVEKDKEATKQDGSEPSVNEKPDTAWSAHLHRNNSFIVKLFHGQLMSKLTCASCRKCSYSFDPCAQISLPIPSHTCILQILFYTRDYESPPLLITLPVSTQNAQSWHLLNMLQAVTNTTSNLISLFDGYSGVCADERVSLNSLQKYQYIIASEISSKEESDFISIPVFQYLAHPGTFVRCDLCGKPQSQLTNKLKRCTRCMVVAYCTRECQKEHWQSHCNSCSKDSKMQVGTPFFVTVRKESLTYEKFEEILKIRSEISVDCTNTISSESNLTINDPGSISESERQQGATSIKENMRFVIKASPKINLDDESCIEITSENFSLDMLSKAVSVIVEWQNPTSTDAAASVNIHSKEIPTHQVFESDTTSLEQDKCSLNDCLRLFMEPERLDESESWKCPKCKSLQAAKKEMSISSPPCFLLLHLKRFTYGQYGQKINKGVAYPLNNFDLSPFIAKETRNKLDNPPLYDLCGVITHRGTMRMGHYTCMVRMINQDNEEEVGWRHFDDDYVTKIKKDKVVSSDAYVLVYRLRGTHDLLKLDRCPMLSHGSSVALENVLTTSKRKRADSVAASSKSPNPDRRSVSEYSLNRIKRSVSMELPEESEKRAQSHTELSANVRRCASALEKDKYAVNPDSLTSSCESATERRLPSSSSSEDMTNDLAGTSDSMHEFCESFEELSINQHLDESLKDVTWVDSEQFLDDDTFVELKENDVIKDVTNINEDDLD